MDLIGAKPVPDAKKIIGNDSAACRKNITHGIVYTMKIGFTGKEMRYYRTEEFKTPNFNNGTQSSCHYEE